MIPGPGLDRAWALNKHGSLENQVNLVLQGLEPQQLNPRSHPGKSVATRIASSQKAKHIELKRFFSQQTTGAQCAHDNSQDTGTAGQHVRLSQKRVRRMETPQEGREQNRTRACTMHADHGTSCTLFSPWSPSLFLRFMRLKRPSYVCRTVCLSKTYKTTEKTIAKQAIQSGPFGTTCVLYIHKSRDGLKRQVVYTNE